MAHDVAYDDDPGSRWVTAATRRFELRDEQVFAGAGRGPTPAEEAAAERAAPVTERTREAYKAMAFRGANQQGEGRLYL
jgi:hypothetical protein